MPANTGTVVAVRASVVDIRFDSRLPPIQTVLHAGTEGRIAVEVLAQRDSRHVRCVAPANRNDGGRPSTVRSADRPVVVTAETDSNSAPEKPAAARPCILGGRQRRSAMPRPDRFVSLLTGSFSSPAGQNPTVAMVEAAYRELGLQARYINCDVSSADLGDAVRGARAMGWVGFNCSLPHKVAVIEHLDGLAESAGLIGAVNCVVVREGRLIGENTDGQGFVAALRGVADPAGRSLVVFGAGGAARAIAVEAALAGAAQVTIVNRDPRRAAELAALLNQRTPARAEAVHWQGPYRVPAGTAIVVNATSIGLAPSVDARLALDVDSLRPGMVVADVIPNPPRTALIRDAQAQGCTVLDGLGMLVEQAVIAIAHWTGRQASASTMRGALEALVGGGR